MLLPLVSALSFKDISILLRWRLQAEWELRMTIKILSLKEYYKMDRLSTTLVCVILKLKSTSTSLSHWPLSKILWTLSLTAAVMIFLWCSFSAVRFGRVPKREKAKITAAMESSRLKNMENRVMTEMADDAKIIETVVRAHFDTCDYTAEKIKPFIAKAQSEKQFTQCTGMVSTHISNYKFSYIKYDGVIRFHDFYFCCYLQILIAHKSVDNLLKTFLLAAKVVTLSLAML